MRPALATTREHRRRATGEVFVGSARVAPTPASVGAVRSALRDDLSRLPERVREDVALVASELLGNAVRYGRTLDDGRLAVDWRVGDAGIEISVTDGGGPTTPAAGVAGPTEIGGRGLSIVASVALRWGVERNSGSVTVWAVVPVRSLARA